jgi:hypothetical protein
MFNIGEEMPIEVVDFTEVSEDDNLLAMEEAEPCEDCGSKDFLTLGIVTSGDGAGEFLILCTKCHVDVDDEGEDFD